jgi:hypothetical protein
MLAARIAFAPLGGIRLDDDSKLLRHNHRVRHADTASVERFISVPKIAAKAKSKALKETAPIDLMHDAE